jgi:hypothetical protein
MRDDDDTKHKHDETIPPEEVLPEEVLDEEEEDDAVEPETLLDDERAWE